MPYLLMGSEPPKDYEGFMLECLEAIREHKIKGIALVALTEEEISCLTAYWNMEAVEKAEAANHIQFDAIDSFILNNADRYWEREREE